MIRAAWIVSYITLGLALAALYFDAPNWFVNIALALAFLSAAPLCFHAIRNLARLLRR